MKHQSILGGAVTGYFGVWVESETVVVSIQVGMNFHFSIKLILFDHFGMKIV